MTNDQIWKAIGDPKRFQLLKLMSERAYCVRALARISGLSESAVSQHLKILREAGLTFGVKRGYYTHYSVDKETLAAVIAELQAILDAQKMTCGGPDPGCPVAENVCRGGRAEENS